MYQSKLSQRSLRSALLLGAASIVAVGMAAPASADTVETVVVTGSLIPTPNATSNSPIQTVGAEQIDLSGHPNVEQIVNQLPQIVPGLGAFSNNPGGGEAVIDMRGLSPNRNLILVDGRRAMTTSITGEVDINTIPAALIDHIDVVSGGGSATYGSDAISGVVNFVLKKDFEGFQGQVRYGQEIQHSFAPEKSLNMMVGVNTADGKGNITMFAEYYKRGEVLESADPRFAIDMGNGVNQGGSAFVAKGRFDGGQGLPSLPKGGTGPCAGSSSTYAFQSNGDPEGFCNVVAPLANDPKANAIYNSIVPATNDAYCTFYGAPLGCTGDTHLNSQGDRYNFAPVNDLVIPDRRVSFQAMGHYDIFPGIELYGSMHYVNNRVANQLAPTPVGTQPGFTFAVFPKAFCNGIGTMPGNGVQGCDPTLAPTGLTDATNFWVNSGSPNGIGTTAYVTKALQADFAVRGATAFGYSPILARWRSSQLGARHAQFQTDEYQITGGLRGQFGSFFGGWDWDAYYDVGRGEFSDISDHNVLQSRILAALMGCPTGSPNNSFTVCAPIDIFGENNMTQAQMNYIDYTTQDFTTYDRQIVHGETHGDLFDLPAGPLSLAVGAEYRKDSAQFLPDQAKRDFDIQGFNGALATSGNFDVSEAFMETRIPLLSDMDFAQYLGIDGGYRYSYYSTSGSLSTWKIGGEWQPIDDIRGRIMWQRAARAPNVFELFNGGSQGFPGIADPCKGQDVTATAATPLAQACHTQFETAGAQSGETTSFVPSNAQVQSVSFGNAGLSPEKSNTFTAGLVITPSFLEGVTASVDYYHIGVNNFIGLAYGGAQGAANACLAAIQAGQPIPTYITTPDPTNPGQTGATTANACQYMTRLPNGDPVFTIPTVNTPGGNVKTGGFDIQVSAQHDLADLVGADGDWGAVDANFNLSLLTQFEDPNAGCGGTNVKGVIDYCSTTVFATVDIRPNVKWNAHFGYTFGDWRAVLTWNHTGKVSDPYGYNIFFAQPLPAYDTFDLAVRWNFSENYSADLVVNNVFDKKAPLGMYTAYGANNTILEAYNPLGTQASIALTAKL